MNKKRQHFVPKAYTKAWKTEVTNKNEPCKKFKGVYAFNSVETIGEGANSDSILWKPHFYTVGYKHLFITKSCPEIRSFFVNQIYEIMMQNKPKPVSAKFGYSIIKTKKSIRKHILDVDKWEFYYYDGNLARKTSILNRITDLNCYILENAFDGYFETKWIDIYNRFIDEVQNGTPVALGQSERFITSDAAKDMLEFFLMMLCRNPNFDAMGIHTNIKERVLTKFIEDNQAVEKLMTGFWYTELYRMFFKESGGFYHSVFAQVIEGCQMVLFEAYDDAGTFITSDNPAFQYISPTIEKENSSGFVFPVTPKHLLFIAKGNPNSIDIVDYRFANKDTIRHFNRIVKRNSMDTLISCEKTIEHLL